MEKWGIKFDNLPEDLKQRLRNLTPQQTIAMSKTLANRNGMVVEYNETMSALLGCNTNTSILGSDVQAKAILCYLLKYICKPPVELNESLTLLHQAREDIKLHPSLATDSGTTERTAMHFLTRVVNKLGGLIEVSSHMAAAAIMGMSAETSSHSFQGVYINAALTHIARQEKNQQEQSEVQSENVEENPDPSNEAEIEDHESQEKNPDLDEEDNNTASATIYKSKKGPTAVMQHIHYANRGPELSDFSLFEYAALVHIVPKQPTKQKKTTDPSSSENIPTETEMEAAEEELSIETRQHQPPKKKRKVGAGRPANKTIEFLASHPLQETHIQRLNSKIKIPEIYGRVPPMPSPKPEDESEITEAWYKKAETFARFFLCLFRPWSEANGTLPGPMEHDDFCQFMLELETASGNGPTDIDVARRRWIENTAYGLQVSALYRTVAQRYRGIAATEWGKRDGTSAFATQEELESAFNPAHPTHNQQFDEAVHAIDQILQEASNIDLLPPKKTKEDQFNNDTIAALSSVLTSVQLERDTVNLTQQEARKILNRDQKKEDLIQNILEKLKPDDDIEQEKEKTTDDTNHPSGLMDLTTQNQEDISVNPVDLNTTQRRILDLCKQDLSARQQFRNGSTNSYKPLRLLVHGGPGTGKSFLTHCIVQAAEEMGFTVACMAPTGIATKTLPNGRTIHNYLGINPMAKLGTFYSLLQGEQLIRSQNRLKHKTLAIVILDEMSYIGHQMHAQIDKRLRNIMGVDEPYGGLTVILLGDSFQLPPVNPGETSMSAVVKQQVRKINLDQEGIVSGPRASGAQLFSTFKMIELEQQMRAADDPSHTEMLEQMRNPPKNKSRIPIAAINRLKTISQRDIQEDPSWASAPIVVTGNKERILLNEFQSRMWSVRHRRPRFVWRCQLSEQNPDMVNLTTLQRNYIYENYPQFTGYFVENAPGYLLENINPTIGLANGTPISYHSLTLDSRENIQRILESMCNESGDIQLCYPPRYLFVTIKGKLPKKLQRSLNGNG